MAERALVTVRGRQKPMARLDDGGMRGAGCQRCGAFRGRWVEWAVTALFIQRLNSLGGEAEKCQREEDDYEGYRSPLFLPRKENTPPPPPGPLPRRSPRPAATDAAERRGKKRGGARGTTLCLSHSSFSRPHAGSASPLQQYR